MKKYALAIQQIVFTVLVNRIAGFVVDQYIMPQVEKLPTQKRKPFGFTND